MSMMKLPHLTSARGRPQGVVSVWPVRIGESCLRNRSKGVVQVAANPGKLRTQSEQKGEKRLAGFVTSCCCLAGCVGSGKISQI